MSRSVRKLNRKVFRPKNCISPNEAGKHLGCTGEAIKQHIYKGNLKAAKAGNGYWWIRLSDLKAFLGSTEKLDFKFHKLPRRSKKP